ncbi:MAG TPA: LacI family DNA-binding transcriptional regulator [Gaiellaceae bacterium]|nr:LacI family DNA-binding transcriptional regulator [Gaiellaceae bacterium]
MPPKRSTRPTIYDVARLAGVSTATVSRALNGSARIAPATRQAIDAAVAQLGYRPNTIARSLVTRSTQTIAMLLPDVTNPFYAALVHGVQQAALERDYTMLLCTTEGDPDQERRYLELLHAKQVDGVLVDGLALAGERVAPFLRDGLPIVCLDRDVDSATIPVVQVDNVLGARIATEHLLGLGHTEVAHVRGPAVGIADDRVAGYREALAAAGTSPRPEAVVEGDWTDEGGFRAVRRLLDAGVRFTAVFAANDLSAIGAINALGGAGLRVPGDVSVVGFDDLRLGAYTTPPLTTVRQPAGALARRATEILIGLVQGAQPPSAEPRLAPELVVRQSTAPRG